VPVLEVEQLPDLDAWLRSILWNSKLPNLTFELDSSTTVGTGPEIHRLKARLPLSNGDVKIIQGVREVFEISDAPKSGDSNSAIPIPSRGKIVLIGRQLGGLEFEESLKNTIKSR
jgi:hypothetical protein